MIGAVNDGRTQSSPEGIAIGLPRFKKDDFEKRAQRYLRERDKSSTRKRWIIIGVALVVVFGFQGWLRGGIDQVFQPTEEESEDNSQLPLGLGKIPASVGGLLNFAEQEKVLKKTLCVYDEYSQKGINNVRIFVDDVGVGRTTKFGCSDVMVPNDGEEHLISINGRSLLGSFKETLVIDGSADESLEIYVHQYDDNDLYELAYTLVNKYRTLQNLPSLDRGNDLNAQKWAEHLHANMMTKTGMMENAQAQIVQLHGYIKKFRDVTCDKERADCPPTYYTHSCNSADCIIERGSTLKSIISGISDNELFKSTKFRYVTVGISYDPQVMFLVLNLHQ